MCKTGTYKNNKNCDSNGIILAGGVATTNYSFQPLGKYPYPSFHNNNKNKAHNVNRLSSSHRNNQSSDPNGNQINHSNTNNISFDGAERELSSGVNPITTPFVDLAALVASRSMPAPRALLLFSVSAVHWSKYDSEFSGLLVVQPARDGHRSHYYRNDKSHDHGGSCRTSTGAHSNLTTISGSAVYNGQSTNWKNSDDNMGTTTQPSYASGFFSNFSQHHHQKQQKENVHNMLAALIHNSFVTIILKDGNMFGWELHAKSQAGYPPVQSLGRAQRPARRRPSQDGEANVCS